jgi:hypothetical protein
MSSMTWTEDLARALDPDPASRVLTTDPDILASFARDQAPLAPAGTAVALVRARSV